jgi:hypothetical protein
MAICPSCGRASLDPILKSHKPYLIIKESITHNELDQKQIFTLSGVNRYNRIEHTTSYYFGKELGMVGLNLQTFNLATFYSHILPKSKKTKEDKAIVQKCLDWSIAEVIQVAKDMKIILMMGAEVVRAFLDYSISDVSGLVCKSDLLPNVPVIIPAPNPDKIMNQPIGEMRNALKVFAEQIKIYEEYQKV